MTGLGNNTYLLVCDIATVLIDAGVGDPRHLTALAEELHNAKTALHHVLVTHGHVDHASGAGALSSAHAGARFHKRPWPQEDRKYPVRWEPLGDGDRFLEADDRIVVVNTPGHSPDHVAFWHEASRTAFSGDLVVPGSSVMIHASGGGDLGEYLASLVRIRELEPRRLLPAHGSIVMDPDALLTQYIDHRLMREQQVLEALGSGCQTIESITDRMYRGLNESLLPAARENVRAHLQKLRREGRAFVEESSHTWTT